LTDALHRLSCALGHEFHDARLLEQALTHRSLGGFNNERLEFLGDGLLNFVAGAALYELKPKEDEGPLSRLRASLVREESLAKIARDLNLGDVIKLGESELKSGGFRRDSILADALEALLGAVYLDAGFEVARTVTLKLLGSLLDNLPDPQTLKDPKTLLQEFLQGDSRPLPQYQILSESGPPHRREFLVRCSLSDADEVAEATGASRRHAEQRAAELLLHKINSKATHA
jgi:ribonuclease-3